MTAQTTENRALNLLIIEDNVEYSNLLKEYFQKPGVNVKCAYDGTQATGYLKSHSFDAILLDIKLPSVNGLQVAAIARTSQLNRSASIYVLTGDSDPAARARAKGLKIEHFFDKPGDLQAIDALIHKEFRSKNRKVTYDVRIINAFIEAAGEIFEFYFQTKPVRGKIAIKRPNEPSVGYVTGLIALTGPDFVGSMGINLPTNVVKKLWEILFAGMDTKFDDSLISDITGEMCNQILGKVKFNFSKLGIPVVIGLPKVIMGKGHIVNHKVSNPVVAVPIGKDTFVMELQFCLSQQEIKLGDTTKPADVPESSVILFE